MNDPTVIAAAIVTVIAALVAGAVSIVNAISAARDRIIAAAERKAMLDKTEAALATSKENGKKNDIIIEKAVEIHTLTNSNLSKVTAALEVANTKIEGLQKMMASMQEAKTIADRVAEQAAAKAPDQSLKTIPVTNQPSEPVPTKPTE